MGFEQLTQQICVHVMLVRPPASPGVGLGTRLDFWGVTPHKVYVGAKLLNGSKYKCVGRTSRQMALCWGICGAGQISHDFVVALKTRAAAEHCIVAIGSRALGSSAKFAATHGIERWYGSYEELAKDTQVSGCGMGRLF